MKWNFLSESDEALSPEISPGPIDILAVRAIMLIKLGFQEAFRALHVRERQREPVYIDVRAIRSNRGETPGYK
ncbi:MAG: hypothetical protein HYX79_08270 [Chloroflexi bacterium]|nr:hypothetical protein [Chloroflexota bacterium]